jgi:small redox-active disulfide protein 2
MKIVVYGPGCARCHATEKIVREAVADTGVQAEVSTVTDYLAMASAGILATPAVVIDGVLKVAGRIPRADEVRSWLNAC